MLPANAPRTPKYRLHRPSGQAVVALDGRDTYLGRHGTAASRHEYDKRIAEWLANGRRFPAPNGDRPEITIVELMAPYVRFAKTYHIVCISHHTQTRKDCRDRVLRFNPRRMHCSHSASSYAAKVLRGGEEMVHRYTQMRSTYARVSVKSVSSVDDSQSPAAPSWVRFR